MSLKKDHANMQSLQDQSVASNSEENKDSHWFRIIQIISGLSHLCLEHLWVS